ncbi:hypothetical protein BD311DRAFT_769646 [Dichomitus squalens]|uniref:Uncharacterized protein n=1 Tax=Dichomitus squalens TaxID=114155 RepID=A0A4V2JYX4_9APHY|nr:hypothetical protein BD311DRAFT_769646 [Dichomitus squalens]
MKSRKAKMSVVYTVFAELSQTQYSVLSFSGSFSELEQNPFAFIFILHSFCYLVVCELLSLRLLHTAVSPLIAS